MRHCILCGKKLREDNRYEWCQRHGRTQIDRVTGKCKLCGMIIPLNLRGYHVMSKCGTQEPWNKGLTKETEPRMLRISESLTGRKRPEMGRKMKERWKDPVVRERYRIGLSRGQRIRFSNPEARELQSMKSKELVRSGRIIPYGGRRHGNGMPPTDTELEMLRRLKRFGFIRNWSLKTKMPPHNGVPTHYKIDLAHPEKKIAIELDGSSHTTRIRKEMDERKTCFLQSRGWKVLRFREPFDFDRAEQMCIDLL